MRELEASLQQFGEFILKAQLVKEKAAPYCVRWVRRFLARPASDEPLVDQVRRFCESLERESDGPNVSYRRLFDCRGCLEALEVAVGGSPGHDGLVVDE